MIISSDCHSEELSFNRQDAIYLLILLAIGAIFFATADMRSLWEVDESRYGEMAREMVNSGDWITPTLNYVKYFEKPILTFWLMAGSFELFGISELSARVTPALCATLTVFCVYFLGRRMWGREAGFYSGLVLSTCALFIGLAQIILVDMPLGMGVCLAILGAKCLQNGRGYGLYLFWGGAAIAFLTKGVLGAGLPWLLILAFALCAKEWRLLQGLLKIRGILFFILLCAPWYILISLKNPEFISFFYNENWQRLLTGRHARWQPPYFYFGVLPIGFIPWICLFPWAVAKLWPGRKNLRLPANRHLLWTGLWFVLYFLFFTASNSKLIHYALPILPPMALLVGKALHSHLTTEPPRANSPFVRNSLLALALFTLAVSIALPIVANALPQLDAFASTPHSVLLPAILFVLAVCFFLWRKNPLAVVGAPLLAALIFALCTAQIAYALDSWMSVKNIVMQVRHDMKDDDIVVAYDDHYYGLAYYTERRMAIALNWGELEFGRKLESDRDSRNKWFLKNDQELLTLLASGQRVWVLCALQDHPKLMAALQDAPAGVAERARLSRWVIIANH